MPPVEIFDVAWVSPDYTKCVHGRAGLVRVDGIAHFGVQLAGASVFFADEAALHGMLLHEFSHCFYHLQVFLAENERSPGGTVNMCSPEMDQFDAAADREMMVPPQDWFAPEDCGIFPYQDSDLLQGCADHVGTEWIAKGLPHFPAPKGYRAERLACSTEVAEYIRKLAQASRS